MKNKNIIHKFGDIVENYGPELCLALCSATIAVLSIIGFDFEKQWIAIIYWILFSSCIIGGIYCEYLVCIKSKRLTSLEERLDEQSNNVQVLETTIEKIESVNYRLFQYVLISLYNKLKLGGNERISVYKKKEDKFVIMSRYSINPALEKINRKHYPITDGFIGQALRDEECYVDGLPEFKTNGKEAYYKAIQDRCTIDKETLRGISMTSRSYYCKALTDPAKIERRAIIVFESLSPNKLNKQEILDALILEEHKIVAFVENVKLRIPATNTNIAQEKGF